MVLLVCERRGRTQRLDAAAWLVGWGVFMVLMEHVNFGLGGFRTGTGVGHTQLHLQMTAVYGVAGLVALAVVAATLLRAGHRGAWYAVAATFAIGMAGEAVTAATIRFHGDPRYYWSLGLALWAYPIAWAAALALSYRPIFGAGSSH